MEPPNFSGVSQAEIQKFNLFFNKTQPSTIEKNAINLNELSSLFAHNRSMLSRINPIWDHWKGNETDTATAIRARQWDLNQLSMLKIRLASAIEYKKNYYQNHWFGKITQFFLKIFGMWDEGNTATIKIAEEKLFATDTRTKLVKIKNEYEVCDYFYPLISTGWVRINLKTDNFYNYNPNRKIKIKDNKVWNNGKIEIN